jgi:hypothetical protein
MTAANLVPSAHIATEVQSPPQNKARISSSQFEVSDPVKIERERRASATTTTSVFPSADVETDIKAMPTGCAPPRYVQVAPELVENPQPKLAVAASFVPSAEEAILPQ